MKAKSKQDFLDNELKLFEAIQTLKTPKELQQFFHDLCTPNELQAMADRWLVVGPIQQGIPYRTIHEQTGVSVTTIGRVSRCISHGEGGYQLAYQRIMEKNK